MNIWAGSAIIFFFVLLLTLLYVKIVMTMLNSRGMGQRVREEGPQTHFIKSGTPTMGGLFFLLPVALTALAGPFLFGEAFRPFVALTLVMLLFGIVGFLDDYIKVKIKKQGLSVGQKTMLLGLASILFVVYYLWFAPVEPFLLLPFSLRVVPVTGWFKVIYGVLVVVYLFYVSNSVNITDGLDGLLSTLTIIFCLFVALYLAAAGVSPETNGHVWYSAALAAGCMGFLFYNRFPAKVMMGDTGSQALGAGIAGICLIAGVPWILLITGFIFIFEGLSVVFQVFYFRRTGGKRIFRMAPIHHHFELGGWPEQKIVRMFSLVAVLLGLLGWLFIWPF